MACAFVAVVLGGLAQPVFQNGLDGYDGCTVVPPAERIALKADEDTTEIRIRFTGLRDRLRTNTPCVQRARLEMFFLYEWWTAYRHELRCADAAPGGTLGATVTVFGDRLGKRKTKARRFLAWELPAELVQRWLDDPAINEGLRVRIAASELLDASKDGGKEVGFMGNGTRLARYRPRLVIEYEGDLRPRTPHWRTDLAGRTVGGTFLLRWDAHGSEATFDIEISAGTRWRRVVSDLAGTSREYEWDTRRWRRLERPTLRIRAREGKKASPWRESPAFALAPSAAPFRLGALATVLKLERDPPLAHTPETVARIGLARNEEEGVQLVIDRSDRGLAGVTVEPGDLVSREGARIPADDIRVRPVGYVRTRPSGNYLTERDGWFADVLLRNRAFHVEPETVQPVWVSFRAGAEARPGTYAGRITVTAEGAPARTIPFEITVWDFALPVEHGLPVLVSGGTNTGAFGLKGNGPEAKALRMSHERLLLEHRMIPSWPLDKFTWSKAQLPRKSDGSFDFSDFDAQAERLLAGGMSRFFIAMAPRLGKWGFPDHYSEQWKRDMRGYLEATCRHLREKGWLDKAIFYSIDEAGSKEWVSCKMLYRLVKDVEPRLHVLQTLNEPKAVEDLSSSFDIIDVNMRQFQKAGIPRMQKLGKETWWYVCCWPSENPNLFTDYPGIDPRVIGWMSWTHRMTGMVYWQSMSWKNGLAALKPKTCVDEITSAWEPRSFGTYNGDGSLFYPGPDKTILCSVRIENYRDGLEDYEYLALLQRALAGGRLRGDSAQKARRLLAVDDRICDDDYNYELDGREMLRARREIAQLLSGLH